MKFCLFTIITTLSVNSLAESHRSIKNDDLLVFGRAKSDSRRNEGTSDGMVVIRLFPLS